MPRLSTVEKARQAARAGKAPTTQAGEFVRKEIEDARQGKHGARSPKQAIAIGLSKARKAGVQLPPPPGQKKKKTTKKAARKTNGRSSSQRAKSTLKALRREPTTTVTPEKLAEHTRQVAKKRGPVKRRQAALKAAQTRKKIRHQHHAAVG